MMKDIKLPTELSDPFFSVLMEDWKHTKIEKGLVQYPFCFEALYYSGKSGDYPWESPEAYLPLLFDEWNRVRDVLMESHEHKQLDHHYLKTMITGAALFIEALFWTNRQPSRLPVENIASLSIKPANVEDRLGFIMKRPKLYHSVVQLGELMEEQRKHFASFSIKNRMNKSDLKGSV